MKADNHIVGRFVLVCCLFGMLAVGIVVKILLVQNTKNSRLERIDLHSKPIFKPTTPHRGDILARDGKKLAFSIPMYKVFLDFQVLGNLKLETDTFSYINNLAETFSKVIGDKTASEYRRLFLKGMNSKTSNGKPNQYFPFVTTPISYEKRKRIEKECILASRPSNKGGVLLETNDQRVKPYGNIASRTIGNIGSYSGLDRAYNETLKGQEGLIEIKRDFGWNLQEMVFPGKDGYDITTTLDVGIQQVASDALTKMMVKQKAQWGCAVVMSVQTGEVLAIANIERYRNGTYAEGGTNYATNFRTQPGSTFKLASMITLLEDGRVTPNDSINTGNGSYLFPGTSKTYKDTHANYWLTPSGVIANSSNIGIIKLVSKIFKGREGINTYMDRIIALGLNDKLGLDIEEVSPHFKMAPGEKGASWYTTDLPSISIGYVSELAPIQMLALYNAVANNGKLVAPHFVSSISSEKKVLKTFGTKTLKSAICSQKTIQEVKKMLESVVSHGTAKNIYTPNYSIAGKTGTIELTEWIDTPKGRVSKDEHQASFCGYFPAEKPKFSCIVVVNKPQLNKYGGTVAAVVFKQIADYIYVHDPEMHLDTLNDAAIKYATVPIAKKGSRAHTKDAFNQLGIPTKLDKVTGEWVLTRPTSTGVEVNNVAILNGFVPNVVGMGVADAIYCVERQGLEVSISGYGTVSSQSIAAGSPIGINKKIKLTLE